MKHLISYSLYGTELRYNVGAIKNAILSQKYPDFYLRFYVGASVPVWVTTTLSLFDNVELIEVDGSEDPSAMFWRFYSFATTKYDYILVRDTDARLNDREIDIHYEFIDSGKSFHIIKDHPTGHNYLINGGAFAVKSGVLPDISKLIEEWKPEPRYLNDMEFLWDKVYPRIKDDCLIHDEYFNTPNSIKSRTKKSHTLDMICAALDENDIYRYDNDRETSLKETGRKFHLG